MRRRVVVTGMGCVTPIGKTVDTMWKALQEGASGIDFITHFDASNFPTKFAAEVKGFDLSQYVDDPSRFQHAGRNILYAIGAAKQAVDQAGVNDLKDPSRFGVYLGLAKGSRTSICLCV